MRDLQRGGPGRHWSTPLFGARALPQRMDLFASFDKPLRTPTWIGRFELPRSRWSVVAHRPVAVAGSPPTRAALPGRTAAEFGIDPSRERS
jgi:hypothetical protein